MIGPQALHKAYRLLLAGVLTGTLIGAIYVGVTTTFAYGIMAGVTFGLYFTAVLLTRKWATLGHISRRMSYAVDLMGAVAVALVLGVALA